VIFIIFTTKTIRAQKRETKVVQINNNELDRNSQLQGSSQTSKKREFKDLSKGENSRSEKTIDILYNGEEERKDNRTKYRGNALGDQSQDSSEDYHFADHVFNSAKVKDGSSTDEQSFPQRKYPIEKNVEFDRIG